MSSNVRLFFRSNYSRNKKMNIEQETISQLIPIAEEHLSSPISINRSCLGGNDKKKGTKNKVDTPLMNKETIRHTQALTDPMEASDHKIQHIVQQHGAKIDIDDDIKDLFGKKEITKAIINQLAQRALTGSMNTNNDGPPRLCTKKHCSFANEPLTIKPVTCVPGIGPVHGNLCEKQGIIMAHQLLSRYMMSANDEEFEKSLVSQLGFTSKSAAMTCDGLKEMRRHLI